MNRGHGTSDHELKKYVELVKYQALQVAPITRDCDASASSTSSCARRPPYPSILARGPGPRRSGSWSTTGPPSARRTFGADLHPGASFGVGQLCAVPGTGTASRRRFSRRGPAAGGGGARRAAAQGEATGSLLVGRHAGAESRPRNGDIGGGGGRSSFFADDAASWAVQAELVPEFKFAAATEEGRRDAADGDEEAERLRGSKRLVYTSTRL